MVKGINKSNKKEGVPKRPMSAYFYFQTERRQTLKKEKPELNNKAIMLAISAEWKKMSNNERKKYTVKHEEDKKRYEKEKSAYKA